jgi:hypothetical protein
VEGVKSGKRLKEVAVARFDVCWRLENGTCSLGPFQSHSRPSTFNPRPVKQHSNAWPPCACFALCLRSTLPLCPWPQSSTEYGKPVGPRVFKASHHSQPIDGAYRSQARYEELWLTLIMSSLYATLTELYNYSRASHSYHPRIIPREWRRKPYQQKTEGI